MGLYSHLAGRCIIKRKSNGKAKVILALESRSNKKREVNKYVASLGCL